jgi:hypothetical protein
MTALTGIPNAEGTSTLAQTFTAGASGMVDAVSLHVGCCADVYGTIRGVPPGYGLLVSITAVDTSGNPTAGADYGYAIVPATDVSSDGSLHWIDIPIVHRCGEVYTNCTPVNAGARYSISVSVYQQIFSEDFCGWSEELLVDCGYQWARTAPSAYAAGEGLGFWGQGGWVDGVYQPGAWHREDRYNAAIPEYDLAFRTYIRP